MTTHAVGVLDTNAIVLLDRLHAEDLPAEPVITAVTLAELSVGPLITDDPAERAARQARLQETEAAFDPLPFDAPAARAFGRVAAGLRRGGRQVRPRALDALIAAIAVAHDLPVYTCNPRDFRGIEELTVVAIPHPDTSEQSEQERDPDDARRPGSRRGSGSRAGMGRAERSGAGHQTMRRT